MGYENNVEMVSLAFWTVLKLAGPVLIVALNSRINHRYNSGSYFN